ncbi:hypothetical protein BD626DRAFT_502040 [Schizophyllum amplum]|uniref:Uncharacterized protein n=1 Tax=Schizophyllum amplum TaxID=97359 RepID=A0A550BRT1_9AGAR|nr:hypothetical protein BD626DRAFT_530259 [Auriculariopsis ampla]TRM61286.1 hypothetical protein BD626DRAFT_502040 [Auriculariopsis ampla]
MPGYVVQLADSRALSRIALKSSPRVSTTSLRAEVVAAAVGELSEATRTHARPPQVCTAIKMASSIRLTRFLYSKRTY